METNNVIGKNGHIIDTVSLDKAYSLHDLVNERDLYNEVSIQVTRAYY